MFMGSITTDDSPKGKEPERTTIARLLRGLASVYERLLNLVKAMESRWHSDPRNQDPDYARHLRELEGDIAEREPRIHISNNEGGGGKDSWKTWILGIVSLSLVGMLSWALGKLDTLNQEVATLQATQTMGFAAIAQRATADEARIDRLETRVYRGSP